MNGDDDHTEANGNGHGLAMAPSNGSAPSSPSAAAVLPASTSENIAPPTGQSKAVDDVMYSEIGINTLLNRLKQSIASARDFASFLQKRSKLEEDEAKGLKHLARSQMEAIKRGEVRGGTFAAQLLEVMRVHERLADNGMQFGMSLHQMHEDLNLLSENMERGRKKWKHEGLDAEKRATDAEAAMQKAKARYDGLAEDYDRARTGDVKGSRKIGLKGVKSPEQYESDLQRKMQASDADYSEKVQLAKTQRESLINKQRPEAVEALKQLCIECDSGVTLQLQKFATFNEKLLLGNGLAVSPLTDKEASTSQRSLRDVVHGIDNEKDLHTYIGGHKVPPRPSEIRYEQHPTLAPKTQQPSSRSFSAGTPQLAPPVREPTLSAGSQPSSTNSRYSAQPPGPLVAPSQSAAYNQPEYSSAQSPGPPPPQHSQSPSYMPQQTQSPYTSNQSPTVPYNNGPPPSTRQPDYGPTPPYPTHSSERQLTGNSGYPPTPTALPQIAPPTQQRNQFAAPPPSTNAPPSETLPPLRPTFGVPLDTLFHRDASAVPIVVIQCILAIETFGLETQGIYRTSGTTSHIASLRNAFNQNPSSIDFRNPNNFDHDINSVASLLKTFFRELPDPLLPSHQYASFIEAARVDDEERRRDLLHGVINEMPDANYATLRALVLHLHRVMMMEHKNRMGASQLALCFAPTLMGTGGQIAEQGLQARCLDTILVNATAIFDED